MYNVCNVYNVVMTLTSSPSAPSADGVNFFGIRASRSRSAKLVTLGLSYVLDVHRVPKQGSPVALEIFVPLTYAFMTFLA